MDTSVRELEGSPLVPTAPAPIATEAKEKESAAPVAEEIDYKAELERTNKELEQARYKLKKQNIERKAPQPEPVNEDIEKPNVDALIEAKVSQLLQKDSTDVMEDMLDNITDNSDEKELIRLKYENSIVKTGFTRSAIKNDLENARILANAPRFKKYTNELNEALKAKKTLGNAGMGSNLDKPAPTDDPAKYINAAEMQVLTQAGAKPEQIRALIEKRKAA